MQFLKIDDSTTFSDLKNMVGLQSASEIVSCNGLSYGPDIGKQLCNKYTAISSNSEDTTWQRKHTILNKFAGDDDLFEYASLAGSNAWKVISSSIAIPGHLKIPESMKLPESTHILGSGNPISKLVYNTVMGQLENEPHEIDPSVFNEHTDPSNVSGSIAKSSSSELFTSFNIPWGDITLASSFGDSIDLPVYPETVENSISAEYVTMPDLIYQYEPWQVFQGTGARQNTYEFHMHRDMWTGDHKDDMCNKLIRFCQAQCYARYQGSAVSTPIVSLYVKGECLISGVMMSTSESWSGPILSDGWYAEVTLSLTILQIAQKALNYDSILVKPVIG